MLFLFFFQAEDGIRDIGVTGVQTCALPICGGDGDDNDHEGDDISDGDGDDDDDDDDDNDSDGDGDDDDDDQCGGRHSCYPVENRFEETPNILFTVIVYKMNLFSVRLSNNDFQGCFCFIFLHWLADNSFCFHIVCL